VAIVAEKTIDIVKESMQRCFTRQSFMDRFYDEFMKDPDVWEKFRNTNMAMQKVVLKSSLYLMLGVAKGLPSAAMDKLAVSHDRNHRNIPADLYQHWLNAMVSAVNSSDSQVTPEIEYAWREVMQAGIDFMSGRY